MKSALYYVVAASLAATASAHGYIIFPAPRMPGSAMEVACGQAMYNMQASDDGGNIQGELQQVNGQSDYNATACHVWQCKGYQFADNLANVQSFTPGQTVDIQYQIRAPHTGTANVSIVDTATDSVIGSPLISWDGYASNAVPLVASQENFTITIPSDLGDQCSTAGACVIQHYWDAASIDQTYEACIDFTVAHIGNSASASSAASSSSTAPTTTTAAPLNSTADSAAAAAATTSARSVTVVAPSADSGTTVVSSAAVATSTSHKGCSGHKITNSTSVTVPSSTAAATTSAKPTTLIPSPSTTPSAGPITTDAVPTSNSVSAASSSLLPSSSGSSSITTSSTTLAQVLEEILTILESLIESSTDSKSKRSHARDLSTVAR